MIAPLKHKVFLLALLAPRLDLRKREGMALSCSTDVTQGIQQAPAVSISLITFKLWIDTA